MSAIKPAINTLQHLRGGRTLDELAVAIHDATSAVVALRKPAVVTLTIRIEPFKDKSVRLVEEPLVFEADVSTKLPKPDGEATLFWTDDDGNPTTEQTRQADLGLRVAPAAERSA